MTREEILKNIECCNWGLDRCDECTLNKATESICVDELLVAAARLIESQPEIIRCKECKYGTICKIWNKDKLIYCDVLDIYGFVQNHYCSYAERKEENGR